MAKAKKKTTKKEAEKLSRTPIVTILGHVDHGKTTILDKIREDNVQEKEVGGITQRTSVFTVDLDGDSAVNQITFIDTPGHEAFDFMRSRGGSVADIVLLIVAADDSVKPQTIESIEVIKNSKAKPIVVINKTDLPNINVDKVKRDLVQHEIVVEGMGGDVPVVEVSGKTGAGLDTLLETIALVIDVEGLVEREELPAGTVGKAFVLESVKDKSQGNVSSIVVVQGEMNKGDVVAFKGKDGTSMEKIRGFVSETGELIAEMKSGHGGKLIGVSELLDLGAKVYVAKKQDKKLQKSLFVEEKVEKAPKPEKLSDKKAKNQDPDAAEQENADLLAAMFATDDDAEEEEEIKELNIILKSSSEGSLEAVKKSLDGLQIENYKVVLATAEVGDVTPKDIERAEVTKAIVIGFEVNVDKNAVSAAEEKKVIIKSYDLIYKLVEELTDTLTILSTPKEQEVELGSAEIRQIFTLSNGNTIWGCRVSEGVLKKNTKCYVVRNDEIIGEGRIITMRHGKNEVTEAAKGSECGISIDPNPDEAQEGDAVHCFKIVK